MIERHKKISEIIFAGIFFIVQMVATACNGSSNSDSAPLSDMSQRPSIDSSTQSSVATLTAIAQDSDPSISASVAPKVELVVPKDLIGRWYSLEDQNWLTVTQDKIIRERRPNIGSDIVFNLTEANDKEFVFIKVSSANCVSCAAQKDSIKLLAVDQLLARLVYDDNGEVVENLVRYGVDNASLSGKLMNLGANERSSPLFFLSEPSVYRIKIQNSHDHSDKKAAEIAADGSFKVSELKSGIYDISLLEGSSDTGIYTIPKVQVIGTDDNIGIISVSNSNYNFKSEFTPLSDFSFDGESYKAKFRVTNIGEESVKGVNYQLSSADPAVQMGTNKSGILNTIDPGKSIEVEVTYTVSGMDFVEEKRVAINIVLGDVRGVKWNDIGYIDIYKIKANVNISTLTSVSGVLIFKERKLIPFKVTKEAGTFSLGLPYLINNPYKIILSAATRSQEAVYSIGVNAAASSSYTLEDFFDTSSFEPNDLESQASKIKQFEHVVSYLHVGDLDGFYFEFPFSYYSDLYLHDLRESALVTTPTGKTIVLNKNRIWEEYGGSRVLAVDGSDNWQMQLAVNGRSFTRSEIHKDNVAGRACPAYVYLNDSNMTATGRCLYYDGGNPLQRLDAAGTSQTSSGTVGLASTKASDTGGYSNGFGYSWYEGNIQTCAAKGMRLPALYETAASVSDSWSPLPSDVVLPAWSSSLNGVPSAGGWTWTASAWSLGSDAYWQWSGAIADRYYIYTSGFVRCVVQ